MKLQEAREVLREVSGKSYSWLKDWGLSTIRAALYTIFSRKSATPDDLEVAYEIQAKLSRKW